MFLPTTDINERKYKPRLHTPVSMPPHLPVSKVVKYTKEKSGRKLQGEFQEYRSQSASLWLLAVSSGGAKRDLTFVVFYEKTFYCILPLQEEAFFFSFKKFDTSCHT